MKTHINLLLALFITFAGYSQTQVEGVTLPNTMKIGEHQTVLNGAGVREKLWIDLYVGALYLTEKKSNAKEILDSNEPMAVRLQIVSKLVSSSKMIEAVEDGFKKSTNNNVAPLRKQIDQFIGFFEEEIVKGDIFDITYQPERGVVAYKNGEQRGVIQGKAFKRALFGIWLDKKPADDDLKEGMLGK
jgi:hypothetical protein